MTDETQQLAGGQAFEYKRPGCFKPVNKLIHTPVPKPETVDLLFREYGRINITLEEVGRELHYDSTQTLRNKISRGELPFPVGKSGKHRTVDIRDLAVHLDRLRDDRWAEFANMVDE